MVTKKEDDKLREKKCNSKGKGKYTLVSKMPEGYENRIIDFPFARYDKALGGVGIDVYGYSIVKGNLVPQP